MYDSTKTQLFQIAEPQHGYFTAWQAVDSGIAGSRLPVMSSRGQIERICRGVYRLPYYPVSDVAQYIEAVLWPQGLVAVLSHESALLLHGLSDVSPAQIHITVPTTHRVRRQIPHHLQIHHADLQSDESEMLNGIPVTTPARSILDCHRNNLSSALIRQAIEDGREQGTLTIQEAEELARATGLEIAPLIPISVSAK